MNVDIVVITQFGYQLRILGLYGNNVEYLLLLAIITVLPNDMVGFH
jgi:hypothetical protein